MTRFNLDSTITNSTISSNTLNVTSASSSSTSSPFIKKYQEIVKNPTVLMTDHQLFSVIIQEEIGDSTKIGRFCDSHVVRSQLKAALVKHVITAIKLDRTKSFGMHLKCLFEATMLPYLSRGVMQPTDGQVLMRIYNRSFIQRGLQPLPFDTKFIKESLATTRMDNDCNQVAVRARRDQTPVRRRSSLASFSYTLKSPPGQSELEAASLREVCSESFAKGVFDESELTSISVDERQTLCEEVGEQETITERPESEDVNLTVDLLMCKLSFESQGLDSGNSLGSSGLDISAEGERPAHASSFVNASNEASVFNTSDVSEV